MDTQRPLLSPSPDSPPPEGYEASPPESGDTLTDDDTIAPPPQPVAPPISSMDQIPGYGGIGFEGEGSAGNIPLPPTTQPSAPQPPNDTPTPDIPTISEEAARAALLDMASSHCCYGKAAARESIFTNLTSSTALHYQLETFTEGRSSVWDYEPYHGQAVDGPVNGPAPQPWSIAAQPGQLFRDHEKHFEVPHTASVKPCHNCVGSGLVQCWQCHGRTRMRCRSCNGTGRRRGIHHNHNHHHRHDTYVPCHTCGRTGQTICTMCQGRGRVPCEVCLERGQLKWYIRLTVSWKAHRDEEEIEKTALPDELIKTAEGVVVMQEQQTRVFPVTNFPESAVNEASVSLLQKHSSSWPSEKTIMQRHSVRVVPVAEATCSWNSKIFRYFVYGSDERVYAPSYPQRFCWGCSIL